MRCLGARALGLEVDWRYCFVPPGERAATTPGVVYVDVGGTVAPGIIDHHGSEGPGTCSAMLVVEQREQVYNHLLAPWLARFEEGRIPAGAVWRPTLVLHHDPDFDALVATFLVQLLIADGDLPRSARALAGYALEVDQGRSPLRLKMAGEAQEEGAAGCDRRELDALHLAYLAIQSFTGPDGRELPSGEKLRLGLELLRCALAGIAAAQGDSPRSLADLSPGAPGVASWRADARFTPFAELLDRDLELFREDFRQGRVLDGVPLPAADGGEAVPVRAFVAAGPPRSVLAKYWVRGAGFPFFLCPLGAAAGQGAGRPARRRMVLSLDPTFSLAGSRPSLRGLGFRLERAESAARRAAGTEVRRGTPRFGGGYCDNPDPWYDGRGHDWTIVDSPLAGTVLSHDEIVALATGGDFWKVPLASGRVYLVWSEDEPAAAAADWAPPAAGLRPFAGMAETLAALYRESAEEGPAGGPRTLPAPGFRIEERVRRFPAGTCRPLRIVEIAGEPGGSLEDLVRRRRQVLDGRIPDFSLAHVWPGLHFGAPELMDRLLDELGGGGLRPLGGLVLAGERVLFNSRNLVTSAAGGAPAAGGEPDPDLEVLLYGAFLYKTLLRFSERLSDLVPPGRSWLVPGGSTRRLREDFLRFQARYSHLEMSRAARARVLFRELAAALNLAGLLAKVRSELDRLAEIEERVAAERQRRAEGLIQTALFVLAVSGLLQTIVAFLDWKGASWSVWWVGPTVAAFLGVFVWARIRARGGGRSTAALSDRR